MYLVIGLGSNLGNREENLSLAREKLQEYFELSAESKIYQSQAEDYLNQPDFLNQVLEFGAPKMGPEEVMQILLHIEDEMGRVRIVDKGPRVIDLDLLFLGKMEVDKKIVQIPHPRLFDRSFVVNPLRDLPCFDFFSQRYRFKREFDNQAIPI